MLNKFKKLRNKAFCEKKFVCTKSTDKDFIIYERVELEKMTIKTLRALAKQRKINLQKKRKKSEIINIMFSFFLQLKNSDIEIVGINKYSNLVLQCGYLFVVFFKNIQLILEQINKN